MVLCVVWCGGVEYRDAELGADWMAMVWVGDGWEWDVVKGGGERERSEGGGDRKKEM